MPQKYCRKLEPPEQGARTLQTTDRRQTDGRQHIANVNVSSRSLKTSKEMSANGPRQKCLLIFTHSNRLYHATLFQSDIRHGPVLCLFVCPRPFDGTSRCSVKTNKRIITVTALIECGVCVPSNYTGFYIKCNLLINKENKCCWPPLYRPYRFN